MHGGRKAHAPALMLLRASECISGDHCAVERGGLILSAVVCCKAYVCKVSIEHGFCIVSMKSPHVRILVQAWVLIILSSIHVYLAEDRSAEEERRVSGPATLLMLRCTIVVAGAVMATALG